VLVGPPGHPLATAGIASLGELSQETLVLPDRGSVLRQLVERMATEKRATLGPVLEVNDVDTRKQAIASGLGIGPLTFYRAAPALAEGQLALLQVEGFPFELEWLVVYRAGPPLPEVVAFKRHVLELRATIEALAPTIAGP
jgi:DNA-binding transcriptional LysR family regulator